MIALDKLKQNLDVDDLLKSKKEIHNKIIEVKNSMQQFHKTFKTSKEIEILADEFFESKKTVSTFMTTSPKLNLETLKSKINNLKNITVETEDFI